MKFITEDDLRDIYKKEPFTTYELELGARLTPGARQFLADRGINMFAENVKLPIALTPKKINVKNRKLYCKMKSAHALFLLTAEELLDKDVFLTQSITSLSKQLQSVLHAAKGDGIAENLCCKACSGIHKDNFGDDLDECFEITEFHMHLEKSKEILSLHRLRCVLWEIAQEIPQAYENCEDEKMLSKEITQRINELINSLSQMICAVVGGNKCQRTK